MLLSPFYKSHYHLLGLHKNIKLSNLAPVDLKVKALSTTSVEVQVIPPPKSTALMYKVSIEEPPLDMECWVYIGQLTNSCTYKDLKPGQRYKFRYHLAETFLNRDIVSENRYKVYTLPAVCKLYCPTSDTYILNAESRPTAGFFHITIGLELYFRCVSGGRLG